MGWEPLVSVIIPTRNRAALLARAVRSVQKQTYGYLEIIVVDDASSDNTRDVVTGTGDPRISYLRHPTNRGGAAARNTGIRVARGDILGFLDDDDEWLETKTAEQLKALEQYDVVVCTAYDSMRVPPRSHKKSTLELEDLKRGPWGGTGVLMAKAKVLKEIMFDESLPRGQDWDLFIRIALRYRIGYLDKALLHYNGGKHSRITNSVPDGPIDSLEQQYRTVHKHRELFGNRWHARQMTGALLNNLATRPDRLNLLLYTARRYGPQNVARVLLGRAAAKLRRAVLWRTPLTYDRAGNG